MYKTLQSSDCNYNSHEIARKYAHKWANRSNLCARLVTKTVLLLRIDYLVINLSHLCMGEE